MTPDSTVVTSHLLISNIDAAFESWESAPWKERIDFSIFCNYILPYRCSSEHIGGNWRKAMREKYSHLLSGETDMLRAFAKVKKAVYEDVVLSNAYCPYELDAITIHRIGRAECGQRAVLLADVLRALGIPSAIDFTPVWADYSNKSHGWVSVVDKHRMTYTVLDGDSTARSMNPIDASMFLPKYTVQEENHCPYEVKQSKTAVKVYREEYSRIKQPAELGPGFLSNIFLCDVSDKYGLTSKIVLDVPTDQKVYICTYVSGRDWMPIACAKSRNGKAVFENIGPNSVCTACTEENGIRKFINCPFLVDSSGVSQTYSADTDHKTEISINRKYPLCQYIIDVWSGLRGGAFLGSNDSCFAICDTLATIHTLPYGLTLVNSRSGKEYRFLRYQAPRNNRSSLSELQFYVTTQLDSKRILGTYTGDGVDTSCLYSLCDDNSATYCKGLQTGYTMTFDMGSGNASRVDTILYAPSTDLNFVEKGHLYELYYFETSWKLIERKIAQMDYLSFKGVPSDAILLLKDRTAGQEERIFEYKKSVQIWH